MPDVYVRNCNSWDTAKPDGMVSLINNMLKMPAWSGWLRTAFGSIIRRHYDELVNMSPEERKKLIKSIGATETYMTEMSKELKGVEYDRIHIHNIQ